MEQQLISPTVGLVVVPFVQKRTKLLFVVIPAYYFFFYNSLAFFPLGFFFISSVFVLSFAPHRRFPSRDRFAPYPINVIIVSIATAVGIFNDTNI